MKSVNGTRFRVDAFVHRQRSEQDLKVTEDMGH